MALRESDDNIDLYSGKERRCGDSAFNERGVYILGIITGSEHNI